MHMRYSMYIKLHLCILKKKISYKYFSKSLAVKSEKISLEGGIILAIYVYPHKSF